MWNNKVYCALAFIAAISAFLMVIYMTAVN